MFGTVTLSLLEGFLTTLKLFGLTLAIALPLGLLISLGAKSRIIPLSVPLKVIIWIVRGTPLLLQLILVYYGPGIIMGDPLWGSGDTGRFIAALVAFAINYACYFAEIYRVAAISQHYIIH